MNQISFESQRYALDAKVRLQREGYPAVEAELHDISLTGMFVATSTTYPAGTLVKFRLEPRGEELEPLVATATVAWRRQLSAGPLRPAGMGCAYEGVTSDDLRRLRDWILAHPQNVIPRKAPDRSSLTTELSRFRINSVEKKATTPHDMGMYRASQVVQRRSSAQWRSWLPLALFGLMFLAVILAYFQPWQRGDSEVPTITSASAGDELEPAASSAADSAAFDRSAESVSSTSPTVPAAESNDALTETAAAADPTTATAPPDSASDGSPEGYAAVSGGELPSSDGTIESNVRAEQPSQQLSQSARLAVRQWAAAWSGQNVEDYLSFYAPDFVPPGGSSREQWNATRRERLTQPAFIRVSISDLSVIPISSQAETPQSSETVRAVFTQEYEAPNYSDVVRKTLVLRFDEGRWQIVSEDSRPV